MTPEEIKEAIEKLSNLMNSSQNDEALEFAFELLKVYELKENKETLAKIYKVIGSVYFNISELSKALEYHEKSLSVYKEIGNKVTIGGTLVNIGLVYYYLGDYDVALEFYGNALLILEEIGHTIFQANAYANIGIIYHMLSDFPKALENYSKALLLNEESENKVGIAENLTNIGNVYVHLLQDTIALDYYKKAFQIFEELENKAGIANILLNFGIIFSNLSNFPQALEYLNKALLINDEIGNKHGIANILGSIGLVYLNLSDYKLALDYLSRSLIIEEVIGNKERIARNLSNISKIYSLEDSQYFDIITSQEYLQKTLHICEEIGLKDLKLSVYEQYHSIRLKENNFEEALLYQTKAITLEREIQSEAISKQSLQFDQRRKIEEDERVRQLKLARFQEQERIFHNILPIVIANRLIEGEQTIAESYENVSIFFSDIVGFTTLSSRIEPAELVKGLNTIFTAFDRIGTKYGLEKIKTIGDAYMAVCGVPESFFDHASRTAYFALEANEVLETLELSDDFKNLQFRIGLHCGSVVAGIIGEKKFAYDVWGDAVNVASRMESNSETGRIHISEAFAKSIEQNPEFSIIPRGEINIKGKGTMNTYWLEKSK